MGVAVRFLLRQFSKIFEIRDAQGQPYVLVGGQAVNYWAERYLSIEPQLEKLQPFTSEDIDFKGGHADVQRIAAQLGLNPNYPPKMAITALSGVIPFQIGDLKSTIEVVRTLPGISDAVETPAVQAEWQGQNTIPYRKTVGRAGNQRNTRKRGKARQSVCRNLPQLVTGICRGLPHYDDGISRNARRFVSGRDANAKFATRANHLTILVNSPTAR